MNQINRWWAFTLLAVSFFMTIVDLTIVNVALPIIGSSLHFSESNLRWVVTAYGIAFGGLLLLGGRAADLLGRRLPLGVHRAGRDRSGRRADHLRARSPTRTGPSRRRYRNNDDAGARRARHR